MTAYAYKLSVITATYNAMTHLPRLVESLRNQDDKEFEWVVADGASTDGTLEYLASITDLNVKVSSQEDFGIYDALNRGVKACSGEFYLVMGADDVLYPEGVRFFKSGISKEVDIVTAVVDADNGVLEVSNGPEWLQAQFHSISNHAVGSIYRTKLHEKNGFYSNRFPIAADQLFITRSIKLGAVVKGLDCKVGRYYGDGLSGTDVIGAMTESYRIKLNQGGNKLLQTVLFFLRVIKNYRKIK